DLDRAQAYYLQALRVRPSSNDAAERLGLVAMRRAAGAASPDQRRAYEDEAIAWFRHAVHLRSGNLAARERLGALLARRGEVEEAARQFRLILGQNPEYASAYALL